MRTTLIVCALASASVVNALECANCCLHKTSTTTATSVAEADMDCKDSTRQLSVAQKMAVCCRAGESCCKAARFSDQKATCCRDATHECKSNKCVALKTGSYTEVPTPAPTARKSTMTQATGTNTGADSTRASTETGFTGTSCYSNCGKSNRVTAPPTAAPNTAINYNAIPQYTYQYPTQQYATQQFAYPSNAAPVYQPYAQQYTYPTIQFRSGDSRQAGTAAPVVNRGAVQYPQYNFNFAPVQATCSCDDECTRWNDCCNDKTYYCPVATGRVRSTAAPRPAAEVLPAGLTCDVMKARKATWTVYGQAMSTIAQSEDAILQAQTKTNQGDAAEIKFYAARETDADNGLAAAKKAVVLALAASNNADDAFANNAEGRTVRSVDESCHMANKVLQVSRDLVATAERYWKSAATTYVKKSRRRLLDEADVNPEDASFATLKTLANNVLLVSRYVHARADAGGAPGTLNALSEKIDSLTGRLVEFKAAAGARPTTGAPMEANWDAMVKDDGIFDRAISALNKAATLVDTIKFHGHRHLAYAMDARRSAEAIYSWIAWEEATFKDYSRGANSFTYRCPGIAKPTKVDHGRKLQTDGSTTTNLMSWYGVKYSDTDAAAVQDTDDCGGEEASPATISTQTDVGFRSFQTAAFRFNMVDTANDGDVSNAFSGDDIATTIAPKGNPNLPEVTAWTKSTNENDNTLNPNSPFVTGTFQCQHKTYNSIECMWDLAGLGNGVSAGFSLQQTAAKPDTTKFEDYGYDGAKWDGSSFKGACAGVATGTVNGACSAVAKRKDKDDAGADEATDCTPDDLSADSFLKTGLSLNRGRSVGSKTIKTCGNVFDLLATTTYVVIHNSDGEAVSYGTFASAKFKGTKDHTFGDDDFDIFGSEYGTAITNFHGTVQYPDDVSEAAFTPLLMMTAIEKKADDVLKAYRTNYLKDDELITAYRSAITDDKDGLISAVEALVKKFGKDVNKVDRESADNDRDPRSLVCNEQAYDDDGNNVECDHVTIANLNCNSVVGASVSSNREACEGLA